MLEIGRTVFEIDNRIWKIFQDTKGNYWFGSNGNGIYKFDQKTLKQFTTIDGLVHNQIRGIQEDKSGNLYFETSNGINKFDGQKFTTLTPIKSLQNEWNTYKRVHSLKTRQRLLGGQQGVKHMEVNSECLGGSDTFKPMVNQHFVLSMQLSIVSFSSRIVQPTEY